MYIREFLKSKIPEQIELVQSWEVTYFRKNTPRCRMTEWFSLTMSYPVDTDGRVRKTPRNVGLHSFQLEIEKHTGPEPLCCERFMASDI